MNPMDVIRQYYRAGTLAYDVLIRHAEAVTGAAITVAQRLHHLGPDLAFIEEAAMLHDIGILYADAPEIGCYGDYHYLCHGYLGRALMENHGLPGHGRVCERHIGVGLTAADIVEQSLPLPVRDMVPETVEEQIICFVDTFYSKTPAPEGKRRSAAEVITSLAPYGPEKVHTFRQWLERFGAETDKWPERPGQEHDHLSNAPN